MPSPTPAAGGSFLGVTATSAASAWAVGETITLRSPLIEHWSGTAWKRVASPSPGGGSTLQVNVLAPGVSAAANRRACESGAGLVTALDLG